ncbi:hypothetical protein ACH5RR_006398 [Cinchona calisaya]|uniref:GDU1 n=1 Tax=Cinchona calisaya TaxID=153742 RepID=A0ABD3ANW4_9GENT
MEVSFRIHTAAEKTMTIAQTPAVASTPRSPWHSPVPYLFGGLAAMLGLIAFALLILACSYWRLSGHLENNNERDLEAGESNQDGSEDGDLKKAAQPVFEEKFLVIMPGHVKPTCLATPMSSRASSFGSNSSNTNNTSCSSESTEKSEGESEEKKQVELASLDGHETADQGHQENHQVS